MDFYCTLDLLDVLAGCSVLQRPSEMQCYYRNKHVTPSLNPFLPQLNVRKDDVGNTQIQQQNAHSNSVKLDHTGV